ncbi:MAG TPA: hypothetical protein VGC60_06160 [Pyrinomonadaceae bacterium]|jgi:hypothetical protein
MSIFSSCLIILILLGGAPASSPRPPTRPFDEFGDIKSEDEMARLDNFAVQLQNEPQAKGAIIFYGGKTFRGRLPRQGEAEARAARLKQYLVGRRGIPSDQVMVLNWGYTAEWHVQLWMVPQGASMPDRDITIPLKEIKFRKGRVNPREFRCRV